MQKEKKRESSVLDDMYLPIKLLNNFNRDWCIKVRVLKKGDMRQYKNARGSGVVLSMDLVDREGTMIQASCFNETANVMNEKMQQNKVYTI